MAHNPRVFLDVSIGGERTGRIVLELFDKEAPKTAEKFRALCTGERGIHLKGSPFGRIVPEFMCCGGEGIGEEPDFPVERSKATRSFIIGGGVLCTAHAVPDGKEPYACDAGFFITTKKTPILNRDHHTIFGKVVSGMDVVKAIYGAGGLPQRDDQEDGPHLRLRHGPRPALCPGLR